MQYIGLIALLIATVACVISVAASQKASTRFASSVLKRRIDELDLEIAHLGDSVATLTKMAKRQNARAAMAKARDKKNSNSEMTDAEWRAFATKQMQLGQPIE